MKPAFEYISTFLPACPVGRRRTLPQRCNYQPINSWLQANLKFLFLCTFLGLVIHLHSQQQNTDSKYAMPLKEVLQDIEKKYGVTIRYDAKLIDGKILNYASWRYRPSVDETLQNVLSPFDMKVKPDGDKKYKISEYEYYR